MKRSENIGRKLFDAPASDGAGASVSGNVEVNAFSDVPNIDAPPPSGDAVIPPEVGAPQDPTSTEGADAYQMSRMWEQAASRLSTTEKAYDIPEHIRTGQFDGKPLDAGRSFDDLVRVIQENTRIPVLEDPFVKEYLNAKGGDDFKMQNFISNYNDEVVAPRNMSDKDYAIWNMQQENGQSEKNPEGWTLEEIESEVNTRSRIQLSRERKAKELDMAALRQEQLDSVADQRVQQQRDINQQRQVVEDAELARLETHFMENRNINGIEVGESDMKLAIDEFRLLNQRDEQGKKPLAKLFTDNNNLFRTFLAMRQDGSLIRDAIANIKSESAKSILERTSLHPNGGQNFSGGGMNAIPTAKDFLS